VNTGDGGATLRAAADGIDIIRFGPLNDRAFGGGLRYLKLDGNKSSHTGTRCFFSDDSGDSDRSNDPDDYHFQRVWFFNAATDGAVCQSAHGYQFAGCLFEACGARGLRADVNEVYVDPNTRALLNGQEGFDIEAKRSGLFGYSRGNNRGWRIGSQQFNGNIHAIENDSDGVVLECSKSSFVINSHGNGGDGVKFGDSDFALGVNAVVSAGGNSGFGVNFTSNCVDCKVSYAQPDTDNASGNVGWGGTRTILNGRGRNNGDPSASGGWNGNPAEHVKVYDISTARPYDAYEYVDGQWQAA
jgi:hypothetical protein